MKLIRQIVLTVTWTELLAMNDSSSVKMQASGRQAGCSNCCRLTPPVTKIADLGKLKYLGQKKAAEARKKQKTVEIKEIKMRPNIDHHDYEVKMRAVKRFFEDGDKVKLTLRFRGREMAHLELGMKLLDRVKQDTEAFAKVEVEPKLEGRQMMMVLAPR